MSLRSLPAVKQSTVPFNLHASVVNIEMIFSHNPTICSLAPPPVLVPGCGVYALDVDCALIIVGPPVLKRALIRKKVNRRFNELRYLQ